MNYPQNELATLMVETRNHMQSCHMEIQATNLALAGMGTESTMLAVGTKLDSLITLISAQNTLLTTIRDDGAVMKTDIALIKADIATMKADLATVKADTATIKADTALNKTAIAAIKAKTDGLNFNGLNLRVTGLL